MLKRARWISVLGSIAALASCSGAGRETPASPTAAPPPAVAAPAPLPPPPSPSPPSPSLGPPTVTISSTGFSPTELVVAVGARVTFVNNDRTGHEISSGLDHQTRDCPEIDTAGFLVTGQSRTTSVFETAKTCRFHDHANLGNPAYQGRIVVQ